MALEKATITNTVTRRADPGAVQPGGVHGQPGRELRAVDDSRARRPAHPVRRRQHADARDGAVPRHLRGAPRGRGGPQPGRPGRPRADAEDHGPDGHRRGRPTLRRCCSSCGARLSFTCVLARASQRFTMFLRGRHAGAGHPPGDVQRIPATSTWRPSKSSARRPTTPRPTRSTRARRLAAIAARRVRQRQAVAADRAAKRRSTRPRSLTVGPAARAPAASLPGPGDRRGDPS